MIITAIVNAIWLLLMPLIIAIPTLTFAPDLNLSPALALICNILWLLPTNAILYCVGFFVTIWFIRVTLSFVTMVIKFVRG